MKLSQIYIRIFLVALCSLLPSLVRAGTVDDLYSFKSYDGYELDPTMYKLSIPTKKISGVETEVAVIKAIICVYPGMGGSGNAAVANPLYARWAYENGIAFWNVGPVWDPPADTITYLASTGTRISRSELANAPLIPTGESSGAYTAFDVSVYAPDRVLAVYAQHKGTSGSFTPPVTVPTQVSFGEFDASRTGVQYPLHLQVLQANAGSGGAPWSMIADRGVVHTECLDTREDMMHYMETIIPYRYTYTQGVMGKDPAIGPVTLTTLNLANGWRGEHLLSPSQPAKVADGTLPYSLLLKDWDSADLKVAPASQFDLANPHLQSWFPNAALAYAWRSRAGLGARQMRFTVQNSVTNNHVNDGLLPANLNTDQTTPASLETGTFTTADQVQFYDNGTLVGTDNAAPFTHTYSWSPSDAGWHVLYAIAIDSATGEQRVSGSRAVRIAPQTVGANTAPTISNISDQTVPVGTASLAIPFTVSDAETAASALTVKFYKASSRDDADLAGGALAYTTSITGSGTDRLLTITLTDPAKSGVLWGYVQVNDGDLQANAYVRVNIVPTSSAAPQFVVGQTVNTAGTSTGVVVYNGGWSKEIAIRIFDADTPAENLVLTASSATPGNIPVANIVFGGYGEFRTVKIKGAATNGSILTFALSDGANPPVTINYNPTIGTASDIPPVVDSAPVINNISDLSIYSGDTFATMARIADAFTASETIAGHTLLSVAATSDNQSLLPSGNLAIINAGSERRITGTSVSGQTGTAIITVTVADENANTATNTFTVTVNPAVLPLLDVQPQGESVASGGGSTLSVSASGGAPYSFQWYRGVSGDTANPIAGATASSYTTPALVATTPYWVRVTNSAGSTDSATATITVLQPAAISVQPQSASVYPKTSYTFSVTATGDALTYQWFSGASGDTSSPISEATTASYTATNITAAASYWVRVGNLNGTVDSATASVSVKTPNWSAYHDTYAVSDGNAANVTTGGIATTPGAATALLKISDGGSTGVTMSGLLSSGTLTLKTNGVVSPAAGTDADVLFKDIVAFSQNIYQVIGTTTTVTFTFNNVSSSKRYSVAFYTARNAFTTASRFALQNTLGYQESHSFGVGDAGDADGATANVNTGTGSTAVGTLVQWQDIQPNGTSFSVQVVGDGGTAAMVPIGLVVQEYDGTAPVTSISAEPSAASIAYNGTATLSVAATGSGLAYQWYQGTSGITSNPISGATSASFTTPVLTSTTSYWVRVSGANGTVDSATTTVTVSAEPPAPGELLIYLIAGQSNADGRAPGSGLPTTPVNLQSPQADVPFFYRTTQSTTPVYQTLRPGASGTVGAFGPEITLGRSLADWVAANQPANKVALIKYAVGGTSLSTDWKAGGTGTNTGDGVQYKTFQTVVTAGLAALDADSSLSGYTKRIAGIIWVQGEKDSLTAVESQAYEANLTAFIADVRLTYGANVPFFFSKLSDNQTAYPTGGGEGPAGFIAVRNAQTAVASSVAGAVLIDTDPAGFSVGGDNIHFDAAGQQALGNAFADTVIATPAIELPVITSQPASTEIASGQTTTLQVTATGAGLTYQWYAGPSGTTTSPVAGETSASFTTPALGSTTKYWVRVTGDSGYVNSATATVTVTTSASSWTAYHAQFFTGSPHANLTTGESATLKKFADGTSTGVTATYSYSGAWTSSTAAATKNNAPANTDAGNLFRDKVDLGQATKTINANTASTATITFAGLDPAKKYAVALYAGYKSSSSSTAQTRFTLQNASGFTNASTAGVGDAGDSSDATVSYVSGDVNVLTNGYVARWREITPTGSGGTSFSVLMERNAPGSVGAICAQAFVLEEIASAVPAPTITAQPEGLTIDNGATATLSVSATGSGLTYQWYSGASGATASPVVGETSATFTTPALTSTASYWVRVSNTGGNADSTAAFVSVRTPYETWARVAGFLPDEQTLDPDGDGLSNLLEFALGGNPNSASAAPLPTIDVPAPDTLGFTFHRATGNVSYIVESSTTLAANSWMPEYTLGKNTDPVSIGQDLTVEVPLAGATKKFLRLRVVE